MRRLTRRDTSLHHKCTLKQSLRLFDCPPIAEEQSNLVGNLSGHIHMPIRPCHSTHHIIINHITLRNITRLHINSVHFSHLIWHEIGTITDSLNFQVHKCKKCCVQKHMIVAVNRPHTWSENKHSDLPFVCHTTYTTRFNWPCLYCIYPGGWERAKWINTNSYFD